MFSKIINYHDAFDRYNLSLEKDVTLISHDASALDNPQLVSSCLKTFADYEMAKNHLHFIKKKTFAHFSEEHLKLLMNAESKVITARINKIANFSQTQIYIKS